MNHLTPNAISRLFPNASKSLFTANAQDTGTPTKLECVAGDESLEQDQAQAGYSGKYLVRVTSIRSRLLDADNLAEKYHIDGLRYAGILPGDAPHQIEIQTTQRKTQKGEEEMTLIEIFTLPHDP